MAINGAPAAGEAGFLDAPVAAPAELNAQRPATATEGDERGDGRPRGRDRNRRPRRDEAAPTTQPLFQETDGTTHAVQQVSPPPAEVASAYAAEPQTQPGEPARAAAAFTAPVAGAFKVATADAAVPAATAPAFAAPAFAAPVTPPAVPAPALVQDYNLPLETLTAMAVSSGLEWVNSDAEKIRAVREAMAREPQPVHVPRERKPAVQIDAGPLVLVETRKDLSQIKLPFETNEAR